jgi:hypothetical protein
MAGMEEITMDKGLKMKGKWALKSFFGPKVAFKAFFEGQYSRNLSK